MTVNEPITIFVALATSYVLSISYLSFLLQTSAAKVIKSGQLTGMALLGKQNSNRILMKQSKMPTPMKIASN